MSMFNKVTKTFQWGQHTVVLETGEIVLTGTGAELLADDRVRAAYLGEEIAS